MDYQATIEFNKYTLAVAAGGIVYALEKQAPVPTLGGRLFLLCVVGALLLATFLGVIVFAAATRALHESSTREASDQNRVIQYLGTTHVVVLLLGLAGVAGILVHQVLSPPPAQPTCKCIAGAAQ
jgi:hypothetical protein